MSTTSLIVLCDTTRLSSRIQHFIAKDLLGNRCDEYPYHTGFLVEDSKYGEPMLYDMNVKLRRIPWSHYKNSRKYYSFALTTIDITEDFLDGLVGKIKYGVMDFALYPFSKVLHLNWFGTHCSEFCNDVLWWHGERTPWLPTDAPPSPCEILHWAKDYYEVLSEN